MSIKQIAYLALSVLGLVIPMYFVFQFFGELGHVDWSSFFAGAFANPAACAMTIDLMFILVAFIIRMIGEARMLGIRNWWIYLDLIAFVSAEFANPLFLLMRERRLQLSEGEAVN
jgi:hypothetical protein